MALFQVTIKRKKQCGGIHLEPGMSVQVATKTDSNPLATNKQLILDAFMRVYGVDLQKAMALNPTNLEVVKVHN